VRKALLYRRGGLGDTLLTFPLLEVLKRKGYHTTAVGSTDYYEIAKLAGFADRVLSFVPEEDFDRRFLISFDGNLPPFPKRRAWLVEYYLKEAGFEGEEFSSVLPLKGKGELAGKAVLYPSSGSPKKNPPLSLYLKLAEELTKRGFEVVFLLGEAEEKLKETLSPHFFSLSPARIALALRGALFFVGNDGGLSHLASYLGLPTLVLYGPTDPLLWRPVGKKVLQLRKSLPCSPCFPEVCEERKCLSFSAEEVLKALDILLR